MVKEGYKETEIGVIPQDWSVFSLKEITDGSFSYGVNAPAVPYAPPLPNYIRITDISDDGYFMKENRASVICKNPEMYTLNENDILFARTGASTGKTYLYRKNDGSLVYAGFLIKASISPEKANSKYVFDSLHTKRYWDWVSITSMRSGQPGINGKEYASYMVACPSLEEQQKIAEALSDMDNLISSLEKLIEKKKTIKQGAMQELLTGEKRLPRFSGEWENKNLSEIADFHDNLRVPVAESLRETGNTPYYGANGIQGYIKGFTHNGEFVLVAEDGASDLKNYPVRYVSGKIWVNNHAHVLQGKDLIADTLFLSYLLSQYDFQSILVGGTRAKLNGSMIKKLNLMLPDMDEQKAIASILSEMDAEITSLEQKLAKCQKLKQGMMQQLLTGKIRLI